MKNLTASLKMAACFTFALIAFFSSPQASALCPPIPSEVIVELTTGQLTQGWTRDAFLQVTATTTAATTDLRGTVTAGWDELIIHNNDGAIGVGFFVIYKRLSEASGIDTFAEMQIFVPPVSSRILRDEGVIAVRHITASSTAALIFERGKRR